MSIWHHFLATSIGTMRAAWEAGLLRSLVFADPAQATIVLEQPPLPAAMRRVVEQIDEWHAGDRQDFSLPLAPCGTPFQRAVWSEVSKVPYGMTVSYSELAARLGQPRAARAVGTALGRNPILLIVPCHRVLTSAGTLGGYAGGLERKQALLERERFQVSARAAEAEARRLSTAIITPAPAITRIPASAQPSGT